MLMLMVLYVSLILLCISLGFVEMPVAVTVVYYYTDVLVPSSCSGREWRMWRCCRRS